jgi:hypothetical protein
MSTLLKLTVAGLMISATLGLAQAQSIPQTRQIEVIPPSTESQETTAQAPAETPAEAPAAQPEPAPAAPAAPAAPPAAAAPKAPEPPVAQVVPAKPAAPAPKAVENCPTQRPVYGHAPRYHQPRYHGHYAPRYEYAPRYHYAPRHSGYGYGRHGY